MPRLVAPTGLQGVVTWDTNFTPARPIVTISHGSVAGAADYCFARKLASDALRGARQVGDSSDTTTNQDVWAKEQTSYDYCVWARSTREGKNSGRRSEFLRVDIGPSPEVDPPDPPDPPPPAPGDAAQAPVNLTIEPRYNNASNHGWFRLRWGARGGIVAYRIYSMGLNWETPIGTVNAPTTFFDVPENAAYGQYPYMVSGVDSEGVETLASHPVWGAFGHDPDFAPSWFATGPPSVPNSLATFGEWNNDQSRIRLVWSAFDGGFYKVFRSTTGAGGAYTLLHEGYLPVQEFLDENVTPGATYHYKVTASLPGWSAGVGTVWHESAQSAAASGVAPTAQPDTIPGTWTATVVSVSHKAAVITFPLLGGAVKDYRAYPAAAQPYEGSKYSGGGNLLQINGAPNGVGTLYVVEALDKLGPFMGHERGHWPGHHEAVHTGGQGNPSNIPNVLKSTTVMVTPQAFNGPAGETPIMIENFDGNLFDAANLVPTTVDQSIHTVRGYTYPLPTNSPFSRRRLTGTDAMGWDIRYLRNNMDMTHTFHKAGHMMTVVSDGGGIGTNGPAHVVNSVLMMEMRPSVNLGVNDIVHFRTMVDLHIDPRDWVTIMLRDEDDPIHLVDEEFTHKPTQSGRAIFMSVFHDAYRVHYGTGGDGPGTAAGAFRSVNGGLEKLDLRVFLDLYYQRSSGRVMVRENGVTRLDAVIGQILPKWDKVKFSMLQKVYHTDLGVLDIMRFRSTERYYIDTFRRHTKERHWSDTSLTLAPAFP